MWSNLSNVAGKALGEFTEAITKEGDPDDKVINAFGSRPANINQNLYSSSSNTGLNNPTPALSSTAPPPLLGTASASSHVTPGPIVSPGVNAVFGGEKQNNAVSTFNNVVGGIVGAVGDAVDELNKRQQQENNNNGGSGTNVNEPPANPMATHIAEMENLRKAKPEIFHEEILRTIVPAGLLKESLIKEMEKVLSSGDMELSTLSMKMLAVTTQSIVNSPRSDVTGTSQPAAGVVAAGGGGSSVPASSSTTSAAGPSSAAVPLNSPDPLGALAKQKTIDEQNSKQLLQNSNSKTPIDPVSAALMSNKIVDDGLNLPALKEGMQGLLFFIMKNVQKTQKCIQKLKEQKAAIEDLHVQVDVAAENAAGLGEVEHYKNLLQQCQSELEQQQQMNGGFDSMLKEKERVYNANMQVLQETFAELQADHERTLKKMATMRKTGNTPSEAPGSLAQTPRSSDQAKLSYGISPVRFGKNTPDEENKVDEEKEKLKADLAAQETENKELIKSIETLLREKEAHITERENFVDRKLMVTMTSQLRTEPNPKMKEQILEQILLILCPDDGWRSIIPARHVGSENRGSQRDFHDELLDFIDKELEGTGNNQ